jgi:cytochrome c oxidase subunit 2
LIVLSFMSVSTWAKVKREVPPTDFELGVAAKQFNWAVSYPGPDGKLGSEDDVKFDNDIHVPVNKVVRLHISSDDVIHSVFIPNLRFKQDAVPGRTISGWFEATKPGKYELPCAELCGFGHSGMRGWVFVHTADDYAKWAAENLRAEAPAAPETKPEEPKAGEAKPQAAKPAAKRGTSNR